ncbi:MAG: NUDIX domain-containing protein [Immundisolibacteraceae bacterium]|nr:NUDIX domain-containing protein [Immundisolibacteraceae bacterium]
MAQLPEYQRPTELTRDDVELIQHDTVFQGYYRMDRYQLRHRQYDGGWSRPITREVLERGHAAAVLPYDPAEDKVILIEQFRAGAYAHGADPWQIEIIAGIIDPGQTPEQVACREAIEEAGCELTGELIPVMDYYMSPGAVSEYMSVFCGACDSKLVSGFHGLDDEDEDIRVLAVPLQRALVLLKTGKIRNSPAIIALQWLQLNHARVRHQLTSTG